MKKAAKHGLKESTLAEHRETLANWELFFPFLSNPAIDIW